MEKQVTQITSGDGVQIRFSKPNATYEFYDICCECGHTCKTTVKLVEGKRAVDVIWHKIDTKNN